MRRRRRIPLAGWKAYAGCLFMALGVGLSFRAGGEEWALRVFGAGAALCGLGVRHRQSRIEAELKER